MANKKIINLGGTKATIEFEDTNFGIVNKLLNKRDRYIKTMHKKLKDPFYISMSLFIGMQNMRRLENGMSMQCFVLLGLMCRYEYVESTKIRLYFNKAGYQHLAKKHQFEFLEKHGYINILSKKPLVYNVTAAGREYFHSKVNAFKEVMRALVAGGSFYRPKTIAKKREIVKHNLTEEQREQMRERYRSMMTPFWEAGYKKIPVSLNERQKVLLEFIDKKKEANEEVDKRLYKYLQLWTPKNIINKKYTKDKEKAPDTEANSFPSWMKEEYD